MASSNIFDGKMQKKVDSKQKTWYSNCNSVEAVCLRETGALLFCRVSRRPGSVPSCFRWRSRQNYRFPVNNL